MRCELVRIGNSRGIRIPKPLIDQCGFGDAVDVRVERQCLIVSPVHPRHGWDAAFQADAIPAEPLLLDAGPNEFDQDEWQW